MTTTMKLTHIIGISFTELRLFFDKVFFNIYTLFPPLCETLYACRLMLFVNPLAPNVNYSSRTAQLTSEVAFYIFIQQIYVLNILNMV